MQTRSGRLLKNSAYSVISWLSPIVLGLLVTPFIIRSLGVEAYGVYLVILGFVGYSFTFNLSRAVAKFVAEYRVTEEISKIRSAISAAFVISLAVGLVSALSLALLSGWVVRDLLRISATFEEPAIVALMIGGASVPFILFGQIFQNVLQGCHRFAAVSLLTNFNWVLLNGGNVLLVFWGFGIQALLAWTLLVAALVAVLSYLTVQMAEPEFGIDLSATTKMFRPVVSYASSIFLYQLFGSLMLIVERAWVTRQFGPEAASYYVVPMALAFYFHGLMVSVTSAAFPLLNELTKDPEKAAELYRKTTRILVGFTVLFWIAVFFGGKAFLSIWIDPTFGENSYKILALHSYTFGLIAIMLAIWQINEAFRAPAINSLLAGVWAVITIVLMLGPVGQASPEGVAMSRLIGVAITLPAIVLIERRFLGAAQWAMWVRLVSKIGPAALVCSLIFFFISDRIQSGWAGLLLSNSLGVGGYIIALYFTGFVNKDEEVAVRRVLGLERRGVQ